MMGATLTQTKAAGFPDRGQTGMAVSLTAGSAGASVYHDLAVERGVLHVRLLLGPGSLEAGRVRVAGGQTAADTPAWSVEFDAAGSTVSLLLANGQSLSGTLPAGLAWHCVEVKVDVTVGEAALWRNGVLAESVGGDLTGLAGRYCWIGGIGKDAGAVGTLKLDEWRISDAYIGPVVVLPSGPYGNDPARWLVVYNRGSARSARWAGSYRAARGVPYANLAGLSLPQEETIGDEAYQALRSAIGDYLKVNGLAEQVIGILTGLDVPGYVDFAGDGLRLKPVPALLHEDVASYGSVLNGLAIDGEPTRPRREVLEGKRLTARIDGPDRASAEKLIERATSQMTEGLGDGEGSAVYLDPVAGERFSHWTDQARNWAESVDRQRLRLPFHRADSGEGYADVNFEAFTSDGFVVDFPGEYREATGLFFSPAGKRVLSVQLYPDEATALTLRAGAAANWVEGPIGAGYAAAIASSEPYTPEALPYLRPLFEALRHGWALGEAWLASVPVLRQGLYLVGDPLMQVAFPQSGWNVYGPASRLSRLSLDQPRYALREPAGNLPLKAADRPAAGETGLYLVRRVDARGREEAGLSLARVQATDAGAASLPYRPIWPLDMDWPVWLAEGGLELAVQWDRPLSLCKVSELALLQETAAGEMIADRPLVPQHALRVTRSVRLPEEARRFCWRVTSPDGASVRTPWSRWVHPAGEAQRALEPV
jgi:hypothetical protein